MASKLIKFCIINHHILPFLKKITTYLDEKPQSRSAKKEITLGSSVGGGDTSSKGENYSCSATGAVTSNGALTISVVAVSVSGVSSVVASIFLELSVSWGSASRVCSNIGRSLPGSPWSIMKLTNTRRPLKGKHNRNYNETKKRGRIGYCFAKVLFFSLNENIPTSRICLPSLRSERRTVADASVAFLEDGEGEGDSAKSEMMVASSVKLRQRGGGVLWYDASLLPRYDRGDSPPTYCLLIWWMAFGPACCMARISVNKSITTFSRGRRFNDLGGARSGRVSPLY